MLSCSTTARRESLGKRGCDVDSGTTLAMRLSISFSFCSPGHLVCEISRDLRLYSKISSRTTQINSVLDVGYDVDPCNSVMVQHGGILLRFSTFPSGIENRGFTQIENFFDEKLHRMQQVIFEKKLKEDRCTLNTV